MLNEGATSPLPADTDIETISPHGPSGKFLSCPAHLPLLLDRATLGSQTHSSDCHLLPQTQLFLTKAGVKKLKVFFPSSKLFFNFKGKKSDQYECKLFLESAGHSMAV